MTRAVMVADAHVALSPIGDRVRIAGTMELPAMGMKADIEAANIFETIGDTPHIRINRLFAERPQVEVWGFPRPKGETLYPRIFSR